MQVICKKTCQIRIKDQITFIEAGTVMEIEKLPKNGCFAELQGADYQVDFTTASEEELLKAKWKFSDAAKAIQDAFGVELKKVDGDRKSDVVSRIMDIRFRTVS